MPSILRSTIIECPVETVWAVLRDFGNEANWHPAIASMRIEHGQRGSDVGCTRRLVLEDGSELSERLLTLSDMETAYSYCMLETPIPLFNYVAHVQLMPVTDTDHTYWEWRSRFDTIHGEESAMTRLVAEGVYEAGFVAMRTHLGLPPATSTTRADRS